MEDVYKRQVLIFVLAAALIVTGAVGMSQRDSQTGDEILTAMRTRSVLIATGEGAVESYVAIAADEARAAAQAAGASMSEIREAVAAAEEEARNNSSANLLDYETADTTGLDAALETLNAALSDYRAEEAAAQAAYIAEMEASGALDQTEEEVDTSQITSEADLDAMLAEEEEVEVDMSGFVATERMNELRAIADEQYASVCTELMALYDTLDQEALEDVYKRQHPERARDGRRRGRPARRAASRRKAPSGLLPGGRRERAWIHRAERSNNFEFFARDAGKTEADVEGSKRDVKARLAPQRVSDRQPRSARRANLRRGRMGFARIRRRHFDIKERIP